MSVSAPKFSDQIPDVASALALSAASRLVSDLNLSTVENDQVRATNTFLNTASNVGNNAANPASSVITVGASVVGGSVAGGEIQPDGNPCHISTTQISLWDGGSKSISQFKCSEDYVTGFDVHTGARGKGQVIGVASHAVDAWMLVAFDDGHSTGVDETGAHKYWTGNDWAPISDLEYVYHWSGTDWTRRQIAERKVVKESTILWNLTVRTFKSYIANGNACSNRKRDAEGDFPEVA